MEGKYALQFITASIFINNAIMTMSSQLKGNLENIYIYLFITYLPDTDVKI